MMTTEQDTTTAEWEMYEHYKEIVDIANNNPRIKVNENEANLVKLSQIERGYKLWFFNEKEKITNHLCKDIKSVIDKIILLPKYRKLDTQLEVVAKEINRCTSSQEFYDLILKIRYFISLIKK